MAGADADPLILTLAFAADDFAVFDALRRAHFPARLNRIPAHLTLFHHLPGDRIADVAAAVEAVARDTAGFCVQVAGLRRLGRGTALDIVSPELTAVRGRLAAVFADDLTAQDRQGFRPHVTIQNKVDPAESRALHDRLAAGFVPWTAQARGLSLWRYRGGPWDAAGDFPFGG